MSVQKSVDRVRLVLRIQDGFGLAMADLADVLRVPREEFVSWLNRPLPDRVDDRIERLSFLASWWTARAGRSIAEFIRDPVDDSGQTLMDLLRSETIDDRRIVAVLSALALRIGCGARAPGHVSMAMPSGVAPPAPGRSSRVTHIDSRRRAL